MEPMRIDQMCYLRSDSMYHYFQKECENPKYVVENKNNGPDPHSFYTLKIIGPAKHPPLNWTKKGFDPDLILCEIDDCEIATFHFQLTDPEYTDLLHVLSNCHNN